MSKACPLFLVFPGTSSTPLLPPFSAGSRDRAPSSNRFRIAAYLDPQVGLQGTWGRDTNGCQTTNYQKPPRAYMVNIYGINLFNFFNSYTKDVTLHFESFLV